MWKPNRYFLYISCINPIFFVIKSITYMNFLLFYSQSKGVSDLWNDWRNLMNFKSQNHNTNSFKNKFQSHSTKIKSICKLINRERERRNELQSIYTQTERQKRKPISHLQGHMVSWTSAKERNHGNMSLGEPLFPWAYHALLFFSSLCMP